MRLYLPSWSGDFRLEGGEQGSVLKLTNPTPGERRVIGDFLRFAGKRGWADEGIVPSGKGAPYEASSDQIEIRAPLAKAGRPLIKLMRPVDRTLTAIMFSDGKLSIVEGATSKSLASIEEQTALAVQKEQEPAKTEKKKEAKAASVRRPTPSCPNCLPGAVEPASEVLLDFLTPEQHEDWSRRRAIVVEGELSGHRYLLAHRGTRLAARMGRMCYDLDDGEIIHFHDWGVPPEEEVLAAKLVLEHREPWLRNEATCLGGSGRHREVFKNPFGDGMDGTESAGIAQGFARALLGSMSATERRKALAKCKVKGGYTYAELGLDPGNVYLGGGFSLSSGELTQIATYKPKLATKYIATSPLALAKMATKVAEVVS